MRGVRQIINDFWDAFFGGPLDSSEDQIREREEETLAGIRERRRDVRNALAQKSEEDAREKRELAKAVSERQIRRALLAEAKEKERQARALREGEVGFLDALGIDAGISEEAFFGNTADEDR